MRAYLYQSAKRGHDEAFPTEAELSLMTKPERKRHREKRRRDRVNASFDELRALLIRIDPQCTNRVDISQLELIDRSIIVIKGLLEEIHRNREMLRQMNSYQSQQQQGDKTATNMNTTGFTVPFVNPFENESKQQPLSISQQGMRGVDEPMPGVGVYGPNQPQQHTMHSTDQDANVVHQHLMNTAAESSSHGAALGHSTRLLPPIIANASGGSVHLSSTYDDIQSQQSTFTQQPQPQHHHPHDQHQQQQHTTAAESPATTLNMWEAFSTPIDPDADTQHPPPG